MATTFELAAEVGYEHFSRKGSWFRVTGKRGNAKGLTGATGRLQWIAIEGDPRALPSSPDRQKVTRIGLAIEGRSGLTFLAPHHVDAVDEPELFVERASESDLTLLDQAVSGYPDAECNVLADRMEEMGLTVLAAKWRT